MSTKPSLGYASRTDAVVALRAQRVSTAEIARRLNIEPKTVSALEHSAGRRARAPRPAEEMGRTVVFPVDILDALLPHAAKRGVHVNSLARRIVETVVDENMVDAVLDDEERR